MPTSGWGSWRISHVCRTGWPVVGGMEAAVHGLARAQVAAGHRVEVVTLQRALDDGRGLPDVDHEGVRYRRLPRVGPRRYPFAWGLKRAVSGADLVHVHGLDGLADRLVRARSRPLVGISTHGGYLHGERHRLLKQGMLRSITRQTLWLADAVWFTSEVDRGGLSVCGVEGEVVPNGVDLGDLADLERAPVPGRWVAVGRLDRHKGLDRLLDGMARVDGAWELDLIGPDAGHGVARALERQARELGLGDRVRLRGAVSREVLCEALRTAELAIFPSRHEAFGIGVVEAMAAGCPVVVSDIGAHRALVDSHKTGFVVDFADRAGAARELAGIAASGPERVSAAARSAAAAHSWDRRIEDWNRAYATLLERPLLAAEAE